MESCCVKMGGTANLAVLRTFVKVNHKDCLSIFLSVIRFLATDIAGLDSKAHQSKRKTMGEVMDPSRLKLHVQDLCSSYVQMLTSKYSQ